MKEISEAAPLWAAASGLDAGRFRALVVGPAFGAGGAAALQEAGRSLARARDVEGLRAASAQVAAAVAGGGEDWRYKLNYARDKAVFSAARGLLPGAGAAMGGTVFSVWPGAAGGSGLGLAGSVLRSLGPWGVAAAGVLAAGGAAVLYWGPGGDGGRGRARVEVVEARPPSNEEGPRTAPSVEQPGAAAGAPDPEEPEPPVVNREEMNRRRVEALSVARQTLPAGMTPSAFGRLAGFTSGQGESATASQVASDAVIVRLRAAGIDRNTLMAWRDFYRTELQRNPAQEAALHRVGYLSNIIGRW